MPVYHTEIGVVETLEFCSDSVGVDATLWVLLHAAAAGPGSLSGLAKRLAESGCRVVVPALHGYGATRVRVEGDRMSAHEAVARFCLTLGSARTRVLFGHSMGGLAALLAASAADRLVVYEPIVIGLLRADDPEDAACLAWDRAIVAHLEHCVTAGAPESGIARFVEAWNEMRWDALPASVRQRLIAAAPDLAADIRDGSGREIAPSGIGVEVLILQGAASPPITHRMTLRLEQSLPNAQRVVVAEVGHMGPVANADRVFAAIGSVD